MNATDEILLRRKHLIIVPEKVSYTENNVGDAVVVSALKNVQALGFTFSKELMKSLFQLSKDEFKSFYVELIPELRKLVGADVVYEPMYPNFPEQVMNADDAELFINAIVHYWSFGTLMPEYSVDERFPLIDNNKMTLLSVGTIDDLMGIFSNLISSKTSLSAQDKDDVATIVKECADYNKYMPEEIPLKENVAFLGKLIIEQAPVKSTEAIKKYFKTATDVLRLITDLSGGDVSLAEKTKYRNLKRRERRMILDLLSGCGDITEDLFKYRYEWVRVGEILHPFEYTAPKYKNVSRAFDTLRNEHKPLMFGGKVQNAILAKDMCAAANLLKTRPGEFARRLDKLIRDSDNPNYVVNCFKDVAAEISTTVLFQVRQHFIGRMSDKTNPIRVFFPKGNFAKATSVKNELPPIDKIICKDVARICRNAIIEQYKNKDFLGNVYIDDELRNYLVPFNQRSASKSVRTVVRGSKLPIGKNTNVVRGFVWWTNMDNPDNFDDYHNGNRVDIDLSAAIYDENWNFVERVSYTALRARKYNACHSGDIVNGGRADGSGVAEFIDIDVNAVANNVGRYIAFQVYSYTGQKFSELQNCRFGWMERENVESGEIFEPTTVKMKMDLVADGTVAIPVIFDCVEHKAIWCDMNLGLDSSYYTYRENNLESNLSGVTATCYAMTHLNKPNIYDLALLNAEARGCIVTDRNQADIIFSNDTTIPCEVTDEIDETTGIRRCVTKDKIDVPIITAFDTDYIVGQLL